MKTLLRFISLSLFISLTLHLSAQVVPQKMSYQAVARDASGNPIVNHSIGLKFTVRETTASGPDLYSETMTTMTNSLGTFSVEIGGGTPTLGSFSGIPWSNGPKFLNIKVDPAGGTSYIDMGSYQLLSVAYAQYAKDVLNNDDGDANPNNEIQSLSVSGNQLTISSGNTVTLPSSGGGALSGTVNKVVKFTAANAGGDSQIYDDGTFVGIGATAAISGGVERLRINYAPNNNWAGMNISSTASTGKPFLSFGNNNVNLGWIYFDGMDANKFKVSMGGYDQLSIGTDGFVGLGTTTPVSKLNLNSGANNNYIYFNTTASGSTIYDGFLVGMNSISTGFIWNYETQPIYFGTDNATRMVLTSDGKLGVGTTIPTATLEVAGTAKVGTAGTAFSEIKEVTGVTIGGTSVQIDYPAGYTLANTRIMTLDINYLGTSWVGLGGANIPTNPEKVFYYMSSTKIWIYYPNDASFQNKAFRMLLMKM